MKVTSIKHFDESHFHQNICIIQIFCIYKYFDEATWTDKKDLPSDFIEENPKSQKGDSPTKRHLMKMNKELQEK